MFGTNRYLISMSDLPETISVAQVMCSEDWPHGKITSEISITIELMSQHVSISENFGKHWLAIIG